MVDLHIPKRSDADLAVSFFTSSFLLPFPVLSVHWKCLSGSPSVLGPSMALCPPARASVCLGASRLLRAASLCVGESRAKKAKMTEVRGDENRR